MEYTWLDSEREDLLKELMEDLKERSYGGILSCLNGSEQTAYLTILLRQEVVSGGFLGFFLDYGDFLPQLPEALASIGALVPAAICLCAVHTIGKPIPEEPDARNDLLNSLDPTERELFNTVIDQADCALSALEYPLLGMIYDFVAKNQKDFPAHVLEQTRKRTPFPVPHPFRDDPYIFRCCGNLIYREYGNPYETVEVYMDLQPDFIAIKSMISEHGPDGGTSWRGVFLDVPNIRKLRKVIGSDAETFFRKFYRENSNRGMIAVSEFLKEHGIDFEQAWAL